MWDAPRQRAGANRLQQRRNQREDESENEEDQVHF
jgi:hypothetical protein